MSVPQAREGVAVITGAAGGMGRPAAAQLAALGWPLLLCDVDADRIEQVAAPLRAAGHRVECLAGDIAEPKFTVDLSAVLGERPAGCLIHTAGISPTMGDAARIFAVNYDATVRLVDWVRPRIAEGGCAVLIASSAGHMMKSPAIDAALDALEPGRGSASLLALAPQAGHAYSIAKRAVIRLVAREAAPFGRRKARIASISPGLIDTSMGRAEMESSQQTGAMLAKTPLGRLGLGEEIASVAVFLCSPAASYVSGIDIRVDGGMLAALGVT